MSKAKKILDLVHEGKFITFTNSISAKLAKGDKLSLTWQDGWHGGGLNKYTELVLDKEQAEKFAELIAAYLAGKIKKAEDK